MMGNWKTCTIGDLGRVVGGATPSTKKAENYDGGTIAWITPKDLAGFSGRFISRGERNITEQGLKSCSTQLMPAHTVLFSSRAPIGYIAIAEQEVCTNQGFKSVVPDEKTDYMFLYYLLKYNKEKIENLGSGTTFKEVSGSTMRGIEVRVPETIEEQQRIASVLSALDDKIEKNTEVNENLEQQAQALFKSWFLDYEPWNGIVPDSWINGKLGDFADIKRGGSPRPIQEYLSESGLRWLKISDVTSLQTPFVIDIKDHIIEEGLKKTVFLKAGSLVLSNSATPGVPKILDVDSCIHDGWLYFPESKFSKEYLYLFFKYIRQQLVNLSNGSVFNNLKTDILKGYPTVLPDEETLTRFNEVVQPMFLQMQNLTRESHRLADARDAILPQLMSGELDVSDLAL
ncbi:restriction endonuclease subunit S [uncultured Subdoligranulum sp.]|uniref:restriction endonuclease subunit S n=1 Tax=uncultured Subdoligranulum sp. TaxID=512298 RepID=UPI002633E5AF|nr:restriction endonuclease subunit S [uncultured Subdoligranulum sp.]